MNIRNILNSGEVLRFHNNAGVPRQKNSEHQWGVAVILQHIYPDCSKDVLFHAITHDAAEYYTGDIPAPVKWANPELKSMLNQIEEQWERENGVHCDLTPAEAIALKCADTLEGMWYCVRQVKQGASSAKRPFRKWRGFFNDFLLKHWGNEEVEEALYRAKDMFEKLCREMEEL